MYTVMCVIVTTNSRAPHTITQAVPSKDTIRPLHWHHKAAGTVISFGNTPGYKQDLDCQYGDHYFKS